MMLAAVDLHGEARQLGLMVLSIIQPLLLLLLIGGFVLASAHLLTMLATRWGDRGTSSKSLFFSLGIHLLLACGIVALIPEYRNQVFARLVSFDDQPIRVETQMDTPDRQGDDSPAGNVSVFDAIPKPEMPRWSRTETPEAKAEAERPLEKASHAEPFRPDQLVDRSRLPDPQMPLPDQRESQAESPPVQADSKPQLEKAPVTSRQETDLLAASQRRKENPPPLPREEPEPVLPERPTAEPVLPTATPSRSESAMPLPSLSPNLVAAPNELTSNAPEKRPPLPEPDLVLPGKSPVAPVRSSSSPVGRSASPLGRMPSPNRGAENDAEEGERLRPRTGNTGDSDEPVLPSISRTSPSSLGGILDERPQLARRESDPFSRKSAADSVPSAYQLRSEERRGSAILKYGGSAESEAAVQRSLKWLASVQHPDGYWDASEHGSGKSGVGPDGINREQAGKDADCGVTALAVLAFLGNLHTLDQGEYSLVVNRALRWLVAQQTVRQWTDSNGRVVDRTDGFLGGKAAQYEAMYCHAMATFAMAEAYAMSQSKQNAQWLRRPLEKAIAFIVETQNTDGGWRYLKGQTEGDMSMFGWQVMALKSAEAGGIPIPAEVRRKMETFLKNRAAGKQGGLAGYRLNDSPSAPMTAEALFCRQILGQATDDKGTREAVDYLLANRPRRTEMNLYYWYYGTLAMFQHGGPEWDQWNGTVRDLLISEQHQSGPLAGSWDPKCIWGGYGGRIYSTAIATLSLEVYYRYLPLYRTTAQ